jgi:hypothetical protein
MAVRENNYHIIHTDNRQAFIDLFTKGIPVPPLTDVTVATPSPASSRRKSYSGRPLG